MDENLAIYWPPRKQQPPEKVIKHPKEREHDLQVQIRDLLEENLRVRSMILNNHMVTQRMCEQTIGWITWFMQMQNQITRKTNDKIDYVLGKENAQFSGAREEARWSFEAVALLFDKMKELGVGYPRDLHHWVAGQMGKDCVTRQARKEDLILPATARFELDRLSAEDFYNINHKELYLTPAR